MRKLLYLAAGLALVTLATTFVSSSNTSTPDATARVSIDELHGSADMNALPAAPMVAEPY
jgi:hypothetical protein